MLSLVKLNFLIFPSPLYRIAGTCKSIVSRIGSLHTFCHTKLTFNVTLTAVNGCWNEISSYTEIHFYWKLIIFFRISNIQKIIFNNRTICCLKLILFFSRQTEGSTFFWISAWSFKYQRRKWCLLWMQSEIPSAILQNYLEEKCKSLDTEIQECPQATGSRHSQI